MAKNLSSITGKRGNLFKDRSNKERRFVNKHAVFDEDPNQHQNDIAKKMKMSNRNPLHGYNPGQDDAVYESEIKGKGISRLSQDSWEAKKGITRSFVKKTKPDFSKMKRESKLSEGKFKEMDIANKEKKNKTPKAMMMDKIADMHAKGKLTPQAKEIALRQMRAMKEEAEDIYEDWADHKDSHIDRIHQSLAAIGEVVNSYNKYCDHRYQSDTFKHHARQLEDMHENLDNMLTDAKKEHEFRADKARTTSQPSYYKENLDESIMHSAKKYLTAGLRKKKVYNKSNAASLKNVDLRDKEHKKNPFGPEAKKFQKRVMSMDNRLSAMKGKK